MQQFVADNPGNLILDRHGSIAPASFSNEYWIVVAGFMADENATVENTAQQVRPCSRRTTSRARRPGTSGHNHATASGARPHVGQGAGVRHPCLHNNSRRLEGGERHMSISSERQEPGIAAPVDGEHDDERRRSRLSFGEFLVPWPPAHLPHPPVRHADLDVLRVRRRLAGCAPNYTFAGFKWYDMMFDLARFRQDVVNNLKWLVIGVIPTVVWRCSSPTSWRSGSIRGVENYVRTLILYPWRCRSSCPVRSGRGCTSPTGGVQYDPAASGWSSSRGGLSPTGYRHLLADHDLYLAVPRLLRHILQSSFRDGAAGDDRVGVVDGASRLRTCFRSLCRTFAAVSDLGAAADLFAQGLRHRVRGHVRRAGLCHRRARLLHGRGDLQQHLVSLGAGIR